MAQEQKYNTVDPAKEALKPVAGEMQGVTVPSDVVTPKALSADSAPDDEYTESINALYRMRTMLQPIETPEQRTKRERREKSNMTMASVSDGLRALSNLFFTTHDAPDAYHSSQREALERHYDKLRADRDRNADRYLQYSLRIGNLNAQRAQTQREAEAQAERIKIAQDKARREAEADKWQKKLQPYLEGKAKAERDKAEAQAREAGVKADNAQGSIDLDNKVKESTIGKNNAAAASYGRNNRLEYTAWDEHGRPHQFRDKDSAIFFAIQHGTYQERDVDEVKSSTSDSETYGKTTTEATTTKKSGYAAPPDKGTGYDNDYNKNRGY